MGDARAAGAKAPKSGFFKLLILLTPLTEFLAIMSPEPHFLQIKKCVIVAALGADY
jgi:hypothetical protein